VPPPGFPYGLLFMRVEGTRASASNSATARARGREAGASFVEWGATLVVIAAVVGVLVAAVGVPQTVSAGVEYGVCKVFQGEGCVLPSGAAGGGPDGPAGPNANEALDAEGYFNRICLTQRLDCANWDPERGLSCNDANVVGSLDYYGDLWRDHPELQWAGMARLALGTIYGGMQDLHVLRKLNRDARERVLRQAFPGMPGFLLDALAGASEAELEYFEDKLVNMQKQVFREMAWQHEAYVSGGIEEMRRLDRAGELPSGLIDAWEDIASGDPERIQRGNEDLLYYEQRVVIADDYDEMKRHHGPVGLAVTYIMGLTAESPIPGGRPFRDVVTNRVGTPEQICTPWGWCQDVPSVGVELPENVADFESRWEWISEDMLPAYRRLLEEHPDRARAENDRSVRERAQDARLFPIIGYNPRDGVC
jgi:hypothetical protein